MHTWNVGFIAMTIAMILVLAAENLTAEPPSDDADAAVDALYAPYIAAYEPLYIEQQQAWWDANITGTDEAFNRRRDAERRILKLRADRDTFARIKALRDGGKVTDPVRRRILDCLYLEFLPAQGDPERAKRIVDLEATAEQIFNLHRSPFDGKDHTENDIREILIGTSDPKAAEKAWKAYMDVGAKVDSTLRELVRLRNETARELGFPNFFAMTLATQEIDEAELFRLFDELDALTREPFERFKKEFDAQRAARFGITAAELRPWHYGDLFFQEVPAAGRGVDLDSLFAGKDLAALARTYYSALGLPVEDILARSDLFEKAGKSPHAYCTDMNRAGDVRLFCNLAPNLMSMDTLLHELGHGVYDKNLDPKLPFVLRQAASPITTEGIALLLGSMAKNEEYLEKVVGVPPEQARAVAQAVRQTLRDEKLVFSRWAQVMVRFEHGMYSNPDQDLGKLWWGLKQKYQLLNPPDDPSRPDYGAKNHIVAAPVYYHSYMMGDLFAAQLQEHLARRVLNVPDPMATSFLGHTEVAAVMREKVFAPGKRETWNSLTRLATGEPLIARAFVRLYLEPQAANGQGK